MPIPSFAVAPPATRGAGRRCDRSSLHQRALEQNGLDSPLPVEEEFDPLITHGPIGQGNRHLPRPHVLGLVTQHDPRLRSRWSGLHRPDSQRGAPNPDSRTRGGRVRLKAEAPGRGSPLDYRETRAESIGQRGLPTVALTSPLASQSLACIAATTTPSRTQKARKTRPARSPSTSTSSSAEPWPQYSIPRSY